MRKQAMCLHSLTSQQCAGLHHAAMTQAPPPPNSTGWLPGASQHPGMSCAALLLLCAVLAAFGAACRYRALMNKAAACAIPPWHELCCAAWACSLAGVRKAVPNTILRTTTQLLVLCAALSAPLVQHDVCRCLPHCMQVSEEDRKG